MTGDPRAMPMSGHLANLLHINAGQRRILDSITQDLSQSVYMDLWQQLARKFTRRPGEDDYELVSDHSSSLPGSSRRRQSLRNRYLRSFTLRRALFLVALLVAIVIVSILWSGIPPDYKDVRTFERMLPQHDLVAASASADARYLRFPDHIWGHGLNNILQEAILMSYLSYLAKRSFVFEDYVWSHLPLPYTLYDFALRPVSIPLNAFISGPTAGGPTSGPRAVSSEFWEAVCPPESRRVISSKDSPSNEDGSVIMDWWVEKLKNVQDRCVEIDSSETKVFDLYLFGDWRILSLWEGLSTSPILTGYTWSPLVQSAVSRNFAILQPSSVRSLFDISSNTTMGGLVAVHLRRGDFTRHCPRLAAWQAMYMGLNQFSTLPDKFNPAPFDDQDLKQEYYMEHCLPTIKQIVDRLGRLRAANPGLRRVYVMTNEWERWLKGLRAALQEDGWEDLKSTLDIKLDSEQRYVAMAVDMAIAEKAEVFVGNGFSSLTSNIVMLRMAKGLDVSSIRFL